MTLEQLERKVNDLEQQVADIQRTIRPLGTCTSVGETFGMFAGDAEFDEVVRLGREYREQANAEAD